VLGAQDNATEWEPAAWPAPDTETVAGELVALLAIWTLAPVRAPAVVGANVTVKVADCPGVKIVAPEIPVAVSPAPTTVTPETLMVEFPLFVSVDVSDLLAPIETVLRFRLVGLAPSSAAAAEPVPVRLMTSGEGWPGITSVTEPMMVAAEVGVKTALKVTLPAGAIVVDADRPVMLNPAPAGVTCEKVRVALPLFLSRMGCEFVVPVTTLAKVTLAGVAEIACGVEAVGCPPVAALEV
jgi:hypothetical protein